MTCDGCGNSQAHRTRFYSDGTEICDRCGALGSHSVPDVFFKGAYLDPHLVDTTKPEQKDGVYITSRRQKADIMKHLKVREVGDKVHGARNFEKAYAEKSAHIFGTPRQ